MKILHIIATCDPRDGGPVEAVRQIGEFLREFGVEQELLTIDPTGAPAAAAFGFPVHALGEPLPQGTGLIARMKRWAKYSPRARDWARLHVADYDAVVVNGMWNYSTRIAKLALVGADVPYVVYPHGTLDPWFKRRYPAKHAIKQLLWLFNEGPLLRKADAVLFTCEQERLLGQGTFFPYRVKERVASFGAGLPDPPDPAQQRAFRAMVPDLGDRPYLLFFSRIHEKKGCDLLIDAFADYAKLDGRVDLVMAGPDQTGWRRALEQRATELGISNRIHWPGMVTEKAKFGALRGADAFILPSHQENFGIAVAEALSCRCPVLISDQVNIWREIDAAGAGLVEQDTLAGTRALLRRWHDTTESARAAMRDAAEMLFNERFTMRAAARELAGILAEITDIKK